MLRISDRDADKDAKVVVVGRVVLGHESQIRLDNGRTILARRFLPVGKEDVLSLSGPSIKVLARKDNRWIEVGIPWEKNETIDVGGTPATVCFKEIETAEELSQFENLKKFHYRGGGGAGRIVPIIAKSDLWDLPALLGFVELSSSMIANTARKKFFDFPYKEIGGIHWTSWDRDATKAYSNIICRISRFVIHPEIRGLGLAKHFAQAARNYAAERWHYGGYGARFLEITADMLRYYKFVDGPFAFMGNTEGNEHRLTKDMNYLLKKALSEEGTKAMPQGGGGIMTLQRGYASQLLKFLKENDVSLADAIGSLKHVPAALDQKTWEALHRLNRKPKPCYVAGLSEAARKYVELRRRAETGGQRTKASQRSRALPGWELADINIIAKSAMAQTSESRNIQDAFGFVGANLTSTVVEGLTFRIQPKQITLICGASGSGKTLLLDTLLRLLGNREGTEAAALENGVTATGLSDRAATVATLAALPPALTPLDLKGRASLSDFLKVAAHCGLAEPQLFVRPVRSLSSGQRYRLQLALAFLACPDVVIVDNFCEPLDKYTVAAVCKGIKILTCQYNSACIVATAAYERISDVLNPDQKILLRRGNKPLLEGRE
ncbi:ATP-binding cassette domain-containing protein [Mesorhizobium sp. M0960]|uniref:ATP-binding cassette domain-containing protein n=1 Tax=unclassified Mesorhizobium TaxID=325217 RepID=UPI003339B9C6